MDRAQRGEGLVELVADDLFFVDVEPGEQGLVEQAALFVVAAAVQLMRVGQEREAGFDQAGVLGEGVVGLVEPSLEMLTFAFDLAELLPHLRVRDGRVGDEIDQVAFLDVQAVQFLGELLLQQPGGGLLAGEGLDDVGPDVSDELGVEPDRGVVVLDGPLDAFDIDVAAGAGMK